MKQVQIYNDEVVKFETISFARKILNLILIPVLNSLNPNIRLFLKKTHKSANDIIEHVTTHKALEILYGYDSAKSRGNLIQQFFRTIWLSTNNAKAVRNRLKIVKQEITNQIIFFKENRLPIRILSIASGSSRAIIEALKDADVDESYDVHVVFLDKNESAIKYSKNMSSGSELFSKFQWVQENAGAYLRANKDSIKFNIIEMVGLLDYFDDDKAIDLFINIRSILNSNGKFVTANIADNKERKFITNVVGWNMIYRYAEDVERLLMKAGFSESNIESYYEPLNIHSILIATK